MKRNFTHEDNRMKVNGDLPWKPVLEQSDQGGCVVAGPAPAVHLPAHDHPQLVVPRPPPGLNLPESGSILKVDR